jgi:uncharacterized membrane protein YraQ (UPF0718 family)
MTALPSQPSTSPSNPSLPVSPSTRSPTNFRRRLFPALVILIVLGLVWLMLTSGNNPTVTIEIFTTRFLGIFIEAVPFLLLGTLVSGLLEMFISREDIVRWLPGNPVLATIGGAFMGFAFPVCECGVVPVTRRLFNKGLPMSVGVAFLLAAPVMNPIVLASTYAAFGFGPVLIGRFLITAIVAIAVGVVFAISAKPEDTLLPVSLLHHDHDHGETPATFGGRIMQSLKIGSDEFFEMGRYLIIGSMLAALMQTVVSQEVLLSLGSGPLISVIVMQLLAFVLSVCSTVDSFLALAFVGTFTTGSIISFLTFGPMVDIKSTLMFMGVFKRRTVFYLIILPFLMTLLAGVWINLLFR